MRKVVHSSFLVLFWCLFFPGLAAQVNTDCETAIVICSDETFRFRPQGFGKDDFENPNNSEGCLQERERLSAWYYFEFRADMPPDSEIEFTINPLRGGNTDFDFAIYGADLNCDSLGMPLRCSFADPNNTVTASDSTGLRPFVYRTNALGQVIEAIPQTDRSEGRLTDELGRAADGFVAPMVVQPTQGFYLLLDFFQRDFVDTIDFIDFQLTWGGSAAPYLNCIANPRCIDAVADAGPDQQVCAGDPDLQLQGAAFNTNGGETFIWEGSDGATDFLDDPTASNPNVLLPPGFSGEIRFRFKAVEGACVKEDSMRLEVLPGPVPAITGDSILCPDEPGTLTAAPGFMTYQWSDGVTEAARPIEGPGTYRLSVTDDDGCPGVNTVTVGTYEVPPVNISGDEGFCPGETAELNIAGDFSSYQWSTGDSGPGLSVSAAATYTVTVTTADGCATTASAEVVAYQAPAPTISGVDYFCAGEFTTLDAGPFESYRWQDGRESRQIQVGQAGTYTVEVTNAAGCSAEASLPVREAPNPSPSIEGDTLFCGGAATQLTVPGSFSEYRWSTGIEGAVLLVERPGNYAVTVTDALGCSGRQAVRVDTVPIPRPIITGDRGICPGSEAVLRLGSEFDDFSWSTGSTESSVSVAAPGTYYVSVSVNGCEAVDSIEVVTFDAPDPVIAGPDYFCAGDSAVLDAGAHAGYLWGDGEETRRITVDEPGDYSVVVRNEAGCPEVAFKTIREIPRPAPVIQGDATICSGSTTLLDAGLGFAAYRWSTGETSRGLRVAQPGTYDVVVTDSLGCTGEAAFRVDTLPTPRPAIAGPRQVCLGDTILLDAGTDYALYRWSTGAGQRSIRVRIGGNYALTVTNEAGCSAQAVAAVTAVDREPPALEPRYTLCTGDSVRLDPGNQFLDYRWSDNSTGPSLTVSAGGRYTVTVTDVNGCVNQGEAVVEEFTPEAPVIQGPAEFCSGQEVSLFVGGTFSTFEWSTRETASTITITRGGDYSVTVTDRNGCTAQATRTLLENPSPLVEIQGTPAFCEGGATQLSVAEGYEFYTWSDGRGTPSISVTEPGFYGIVVRADNGCITSDEVEVVENPAPQPALGATLDYCPEDTARLDAGAGFRTYRWSTGAAGQVLEVAEPGIYQVTVTDAIGCSGSAQTIVRRLTPPNPAIDTRQVLCEGATKTLRADANFESFRWSTGDTTLTIEVDRPGQYAVSLTDDRGCGAAKTIQLEEAPAPQFEVSGPRHFCSGETVTLGIEAVFPEVSWSTGSTRRSTAIQRPGTYSVTVTNADGCTTEKNLTIEEIPVPVADAGSPALLDCRQPVARLGGPGGTSGQRYIYQWSGPGIEAAAAELARPEVSAGGTYVLQVIDTLYGCRSPLDSVRVEDARFTPPVLLAPVDTLDCLTDSVQLTVDVPAALPSMVYRWEAEDGGSAPPPAESLTLVVRQPGSYAFTVLDTLSGCRNQVTARVLQDRGTPLVDAGPDRQLDCRQAEVLLDASATSADPSLEYTWNTEMGSFSDRRNPLGPLVNAPGWYVLLVRNNQNGCEGRDSVRVVRDLTAPSIEASVSGRLDCDVPEVTLLANNRDSSQQLRYEWESVSDPFFSAAGERVPVERAGRYRLIAINEQTGCPAADTVEVLQNENLPNAVEWEARPTTCFGDTDGVLTVLGVRGGEGPYLYALDSSGLLSEPRFAELDAGSYELTIQDINGCELTVPVTVGEGNALTLDVGEDRTIPLGDSTVLEAVISIPNEAVGFFNWTAPGPFDCDSCQVISVAPLEKTLYKAVVEDLNGCVAVDSVEIDVIPEDRIFIPTAFSPNGDGNNDVFLIYSGNDVARINYLKIFTRWGETVYENEDFLPNDPAQAWDGRHRGRFLNPAVFVYLAEIELINGEVKLFKGDVTLMR